MAMMLDAGEGVPIYSPVCVFCKHWMPLGKRQCAAFPDEYAIPLVIWLGENPHTDPHPLDGGIRFEPTPIATDIRSIV
jgi:hypothetical protein